MTHKSVIPAQAGIQQGQTSREADKTAILSRFAGMTWQVFRFSNFIMDDLALSSIMEISIMEGAPMENLSRIADEASFIHW